MPKLCVIHWIEYERMSEMHLFVISRTTIFQEFNQFEKLKDGQNVGNLGLTCLSETACTIGDMFFFS